MPDCCQTKEAITCENGRVTCLFLNVVSGTGVFPEQVTQLTVLTKPIFFGTGFTGEIPKDLGKLTKLKKLDLTHNRLTDQIPDLSGLKELTFMSLALNSLSGPIPDSLGKLTKLEALGLFNNKLTDKSLGKLSKLYYLNVTSNNLNGSAGVFETLNLLHMLGKLFDKRKSPVYVLSTIAIVFEYLAVRSIYSVRFAMSVFNQLAMIPVNSQTVIFAIWCLLHLIAIGLGPGVYLPLADGLYNGNIFLNPAFTQFQQVLSIGFLIETVYICIATILFIRHIVTELQLSIQTVSKELFTKRDGLKFLGLIGVRLFCFGTNLSALHQPWAIFVVLQTAFLVSKDLLANGQSSASDPMSGVRSNTTAPVHGSSCLSNCLRATYD
ncbi:hypothetical protein EDD86DRAFT_247477 [Gorgonomyces haynaldii]|nr:hypothetical protein EDD86DRAFT_247477 [Gorgonomyces haynaldii]